MTRLIIIFLLVPVLSIAQYRPQGELQFSVEYSTPSETKFNVGKLERISDAAVQKFIANYRQLDLESTTLLLLDSVKSPISWHYNYGQLHQGIEVYGAGIKVNLDLKGQVRSVTNNLIRISDKLSTNFPNKERFIAKYPSAEYNYCYFKYKGELLPAVRVHLKGANHSNIEMIVDNEDNVLYTQDLNRYLFSDSLVSAKVFLPDPLTTAGKNYGGAYADNADADNSELNNERYDVTMIVDYSNDSFRLVSPRIEILDFSTPSTTIAISDTPVFNFSRSQDEFEDVNCFYHLTVFQDYMQSLGFNLVNYQLGVDAHAFTTDNSMFSYPKLYFGDGCVDDGEDADVIIHEYGHAITASAAPNTWTGSERKALDEAAGDYLATSYTRDLNPFNWELMFGWDGNNACWPGRTTASSKVYPSGLQGDTHLDGEIWSSALMQIWEVLGRETTDQIFLQSLYSYAKNISMTDAAYMFLDADSLLNGGANYITAYYWLEKRGFLPPLPFFAATDGNGESASCNGICDASAVVVPMSGIAPFTYSWKDSTGASIGSTDTITGLCAGKYTVFLTDAAGDTITVNVKARQPSLMVPNLSTVDATCAVCGNGTAFIQTNGGTPPYSYQWNDPSLQTSKEAEGLDSGYQSVVIIDANGCSILDSGLVGVSNSGTLGMLFPSFADLSCNGNCTGSIEAAAYGGVAPYTFQWNDPSTQTSAVVTDLCAGVFTVTISDANGDSLVDSLSLSEPAAVTSVITTVPDSGNGEGSASLVVTNGTLPLTYMWSDTQAQSNSMATGLSGGVYTVTWIDANGCTDSASDTVAVFISTHELSAKSISIYPNPSTGALFIRSSKIREAVNFKLTNLMGQLLFDEMVQPNEEIDLSSLPIGLYYIEVILEEAPLHRGKLILY